MEEKGGKPDSEGRIFWVTRRMIIIKVHKGEKRNIVSICDENLIGKKFEDKSFQLDVSESFYKGQPLSEEEILGVVRNADSLNIVGKDSIRFALKNRLIDEPNIIKIKKISHAIAILK
ncbi:DUF424 family protein [Candidatus Woesearchaeota archaeon]|nr:DUF424 family protein [Candidatus Woesearchaeota archaeon]